MFGLGAPELVIVLVIVLLLFGGAKLPQLARSLGQAKREFETSAKDPEDQTHDATRSDATRSDATRGDASRRDG